MAKRMAVLALVALSLLAVGCSSSKKQDAASNASSAPSSSSTTSSGSGDSTTSKASTATGTGDVAAFCSAFTSLGALNDNASVNNKADVVTALKDSAQKIRDNAPADIADSANAYADLLDKAAEAMSIADSEAAMGQAMAGMAGAGTGQAIVPVVKYAATNCPSN